MKRIKNTSELPFSDLQQQFWELRLPFNLLHGGSAPQGTTQTKATTMPFSRGVYDPESGRPFVPMYEGGSEKTRNYLLEGRPLVGQDSPAR